MTVPTYDQFIEPVLRYLAAHPDGVRAAEAHDAAANAMHLSEEARSERLPSGLQYVYKNRAGWAHDRLKRAGLSSAPRRGFWKLTPEGHAFVARNPAALTRAQIAEIAAVEPGSTLRAGTPGSGPEPVPAPVVVESPDDRLDSALGEIRIAVSAELLEAILEASPKFFEVLVLDLLHAMGYGTSRTDLQRVGGTGDAGIDGVISLDRLGLEKVYVQAKRWQNSVGRPDVQAFYGALAGQRANKGVFITTSTFTAQAAEFAQSVERIVLVDGTKLTELMIEHGVGVSHRTVKVPKVDSDYFEE
jgi:restriction system protein